MKSNLLKNVLDWVLATGVLLSIIFLVQYYFRTKELRSIQPTLQIESAKYQQNHGVLNMVINETLEYGKTRPDANLTRILESVGIGKPAPAAGPVTKPAGK